MFQYVLDDISKFSKKFQQFLVFLVHFNLN